MLIGLTEVGLEMGWSRNQQMGLICMNGVLVVFVPLRVVGNISSYQARTVLKDQAKSQTLEVAKGLGHMANLAVQE